MKRLHGILETVNQQPRRRAFVKTIHGCIVLTAMVRICYTIVYRVEQPLFVIEQTASYCVFQQKLVSWKYKMPYQQN